MNDMKKGWEVKKLGEVCEIRPPKSEIKDKIKDSDFVTFLPMEDLGIKEKYIQWSKEKKTREVFGNYTYFSNDDLLLAKITPCFENGKLGIAKNLKNGIGFGSSEYIVFRTKGQLSNEYLFYFLSQERFREEGKKRMTGAVGHKRVSKDFIENYQIPLPPLSEQKRIVSILDRAFAAIGKARANTEKNLQNAKELFESYLQGIFSQHHGLNGLKDSTEKKSGQSAQSGKISDSDKWEEKKLGEITTKIGSGATPSGGEKSYKKHGISLIRSLNVYDDGFRIKDLAYIDEIQASKLNGVTVEENDILFNITGASVARCCIVPKEFLPARVNQHVAIIRSKKHILLPEFIQLSLISKENKDKLLKTGEQGATRQAITKAQLENFKLSFPKSLQEQEYIIRKVVAFKEKVTLTYFRYHQKLTSLDELKKSILQKAFSGELKTATQYEEDLPALSLAAEPEVRYQRADKTKFRK